MIGDGTGAGLIDAILLVLLVTLGIYVFRLNRKIDRLRAALLEVGPSLAAYEGAISNHKESMSSFTERLEVGPLTSLVATQGVVGDDATDGRMKEAMNDLVLDAGAEDDQTDDLSRVFYGTFGTEVK